MQLLPQMVRKNNHFISFGLKQNHNFSIKARALGIYDLLMTRTLLQMLYHHCNSQR